MAAVQYDPKLVRRYQFARNPLLRLPPHPPSELKFIWTQPKKPSTYFYFFCRYSLLANLLWLLEKAGRPEVLVGMPDLQEKGLSCNTVAKTAGGVGAFRAYWAVWGLRTHALATDMQRKVVSWVLGFIAFCIVVCLIAKEIVQSCSDPPWLTNVGITIAVLVLLFEILAFAIASWRAWSSIRQDTKFWENPRKSLNYVVFSQGLLYLTAVLLSSIVTAVCNLQIWGGFARPLNSLKLPLSCLLTARFILQLRKWEHVSSSSTIHRTAGWQDDGGMSFSRGALATGAAGEEGGGKGGKEVRTVSSEGETSTTMSFGTVGTRLARPTGNGSKLRRILGTAVKDELGGNVGPSKSDEDVGLANTPEDGGHTEVERGSEMVEMQSRQRRPVSGPGGGVGVEQRGADGGKASERV
ncbi:hypothetical protein FA13DRAFT_1739826 [Coprinellus micaceus]|uniref:Uncharacterized protein n=1 Tax=Coprinellus micaceus TaxID=71717 RepID=A0A4Y7SP55_COPMI|nr:hypothetical protein FA13DRAFT_1739826 [Coprinellus micaceus]